MTVGKVAGERILFTAAQALAAQPHSCLYEEEGFLDLRIPVAKLDSIDSAVRESIWDLINRHCDSLKGVLIAYRHLKLLANDVALNDFLEAFTEIRVRGMFIVFRPQPGNHLEGTITKVSARHVGCLVHKNFTASIESSDGVRFEKFKVGDRVLFQVHKIENRNGICHVRGLLTKNLLKTGPTSQKVEEHNPWKPSADFSGPSDYSRIDSRRVDPVAIRYCDSGMSSGPSSVTTAEESFSDATSSLTSTPKKKRKKHRKSEQGENPFETVEELSFSNGHGLEVAELGGESGLEDTGSVGMLSDPEQKSRKKKTKKAKGEIMDNGSDKRIFDGGGDIHVAIPTDNTQAVPDKATVKKKRKRFEMETDSALPVDTAGVDGPMDTVEVLADEVVQKKKKRKKSKGDIRAEK